MHTRHAKSLLAAAVVGIALFGAGCSDQNSPQTVGQRIDRPADKMAATDIATVQAARSIDDGTITIKVKTAMLTDPALKALQINVGTKDGVVTLVGAVDSQAIKDRATQVTEGVSGVKSVDNNLTIKTTG
jgi:hyperosmotically inducible periplasmic protein